MKDFHGKVAVITGAASGLGREFANMAASLGMKLVLGDVQRKPGFADSTGPCQGQSPAAGVGEVLADRLGLPLAADQRRWLAGKRAVLLAREAAEAEERRLAGLNDGDVALGELPVAPVAERDVLEGKA